MKIKFYTLLYIDLEEKRTLQGAQREGIERLKIFVKNIVLLNCSLLAANSSVDGVIVLTNNSAIINEILCDIGYSGLNIIEIPFDFDVPKGIKFYSAHFKIDAFKYLSTRPDNEYSILLDNDIVALKPLSTTFYDVVQRREPMCYKINEADADIIQSDCRKIYQLVPIVEWIGGELLGGVNSLYSEIYSKCMRIASTYFNQLNNGLFHIGDEMLTSISVAQMASEGIRFVDAGTLGFLYRYWGMHEHEPLEHFNPIFAHLPADKVWMASINLKDGFDVKIFSKSYRRHLRLFRVYLTIKTALRR